MASTEKEVRIVLLGKPGSGKSSSGNTLLNKDEFTVSVSLVSVTTTCSNQQSLVGDNNISIIDTPGLFDTSRTEDHCDVIKKCMEMSAPGPHVFLLVIRLDVRITDEEMNAVKWIQKNFGEDAVKYTMILFTHADALKGKSLDEYVGKSKEVQALIDSCGGRFHLFNNEDVENRSQVTELMEKIEKMLEENGGKHYSNELFKSAQKKIQWENLSQKSLDVGKKTLSVIGGGVVMTVAGAAVVGASVATAGAAVVAQAVAATGVIKLISGVAAMTTAGVAIAAKYRRKKESDAE
ncbi:GTPase IMAP family member 9-like [Triplophysa rosa]|uniref:GTPase IMAP family member 9-like n=1 Tax=Triplophysa rosa TaxID=992332 RepID=UPI002545F726|nr:GTPase IMAP family member 9-like [Triplophysa rosa]